MTDLVSDSFRSFGGIELDNDVVENLSSVRNDNSSYNISIDKQNNVKHLREDIIGTYDIFTGPYGDRPIIYADWTASGKCVKKIENYIIENVIPLYGNYNPYNISILRFLVTFVDFIYCDIYMIVN